VERESQARQPVSDSRPGRKGTRVGRRTVIKMGAATAAGLTLGTTYLKPGMVSVGVQDTYAVSQVDPPCGKPFVDGSSQECGRDVGNGREHRHTHGEPRDSKHERRS